MWYSRTEKSCSHPPSPGFTAREADSQACLKHGWKAAWLFRTGEEEEVQGECFSRFCLTRWIDRPVSGHLGFLQEFVTWNRGANCEQRRLIWGDWNPRLVNCLPGTLFPTGRHWYLSTLPDLWQNRELLAKKKKKIRTDVEINVEFLPEICDDRIQFCQAFVRQPGKRCNTCF